MRILSAELKLKAAKAWFRIGGAITPKLTARIVYGAFFTRPFVHKPLPSDLELIAKAKVVDSIFEHKRVKGYTWGDGDKVVLLAHGWSSHALTMRKFVLPLVESGFKVVAFDAPAHGNSEGVSTNGIQYRAFLEQLCNEYKPYAVLAHSLGGICALCALALSPQISVKKVIALAVPTTSTIMVEQFLLKTKLHKSAYSYFEHYARRKLGIDHNQFDLSQMYPDGIKYDGMIIHDANDNLIPFTESIKLAKTWPNAKILTTHGLDHSGVLKDAMVVKEVVNWICT